MKFDPYAVFELNDGYFTVRSLDDDPKNVAIYKALGNGVQVSESTNLKTALEMRDELNEARKKETT